MKKTYRFSEPEESGINIVPFVDVMLVLLVIVLSAASFMKNDALSLKPPKNTVAQGQVKEAIEISISSGGMYWINGAKVPKEALAINLDRFSTTQEINIKADKAVAYDEFVALYALLSSKHFENVNLITER